MDAYVLSRAQGPVMVMALAAAQGKEYDRANSHGVAHFRELGAEAYSVPDPREQTVTDVVRDAGLVVLPGGSPARLLNGLRETGLDEVLREQHEAGQAVLGASAGAMVLCEWTVLPEEGPRIADGLGLASGMVVVPHWHGARDDWLSVIDRGTVLGIAEESGVVIENGVMTAVGHRDVRIVREETDLRVGNTRAAP
jgi:cyanophycinase-like exopeptidase